MSLVAAGQDKPWSHKATRSSHGWDSGPRAAAGTAGGLTGLLHAHPFLLRTDQHRSGGSWISLNTPWQHKVAEGDPQTTPPRDPGVWQDRGHHPLCQGLGVFGERNRKCRSFMGTAFSAGGCFLG